MPKNLILDSIRNLKFEHISIQEPEKEFLLLIQNYLKKARKNNYFFQIKGVSKKDLVNFTFFLRVLDFRLWEFPDNWKVQNKQGFFGLAERLKTLFKFPGVCPNFKDFKKIISPKESVALAKLRYKLFIDAGKWLDKKWRGNFENYFEKNRKAKDFVFNLCQLEKFRDFSRFNNRLIYFLKPNQLLYFEYLAAAKKITKFKNQLKNLTIFADYLIPAILLRHGVLKLKKTDYDKFINGKKIVKNKKLEIELRAASILACEKIKKALGNYYSFEIDSVLWHIAENDARLKHFKAKTIFY